MHAVVINSLEEYLSGTLKPAELHLIETHLAGCLLCREEIQSMREISTLFGSLKCEEPLEPAAGFAARVMQQAGRPAAVASVAGWFGFDLVFGRRLAFASLVMLAIMGSYLVTRETRYSAEGSPEAIMAQQNAPAFEARAEDNMLITLAAYEH